MLEKPMEPAQLREIAEESLSLVKSLRQIDGDILCDGDWYDQAVLAFVSIERTRNPLQQPFNEAWTRGGSYVVGPQGTAPAAKKLFRVLDRFAQAADWECLSQEYEVPILNARNGNPRPLPDTGTVDAVENAAQVLLDILESASDDGHGVDASEDDCEPTRSYVKAEEAEKVAQLNWKQLRTKANATAWADVIGCHRTTIPKLQTWRKAKRWRTSRKAFQKTLPGISSKQLDGLADGDRDVLDKLIREEESEAVRNLPEAERQELFDLIREQAMGAEPSPVDS